MSYVLIVDDEAPVRTIVTRILQPSGFDVQVAANANDALAAIGASVPAVVVCDVHMPGPNGLWLADRIRDLCPTTAIVLATGDETVPPVESLRKGVIAYVLKPFRGSQLLRAVQDGVRWSAEQESTRTAARRHASKLLPS